MQPFHNLVTILSFSKQVIFDAAVEKLSCEKNENIFISLMKVKIFNLCIQS